MDSHEAQRELVGRLTRRCDAYERRIVEQDERIEQLERELASKNGDG